MTEDRSLTALDVARILGVSRSQAYDFIRTMVHERFGARCIRVRESAFEAWRASRTQAPAAPPAPHLVGLRFDDRPQRAVPAVAGVRVIQPRIKRPKEAK